MAGLDARIEYACARAHPQGAFAQHGWTEGAREAIWQFNVGLIDALCDMVPAVKLPERLL